MSNDHRGQHNECPNAAQHRAGVVLVTDAREGQKWRGTQDFPLANQLAETIPQEHKATHAKTAASARVIQGSGRWTNSQLYIRLQETITPVTAMVTHLECESPAVSNAIATVGMRVTNRIPAT